MEFTPVIIAHIAAAGGALVFGALTLTLRKGTRTHKLFGRIWVALMVITALVSFGIRANGSFSWIHILSVVTLVSLAASIFAAIHGNIRAHRRGMMAVYSSLVIAGVFTLLPYRRLGSIVWGAVGLV